MSAIIGTIMAIVFVSLAGGKIAQYWTEREFDRQWGSYRRTIAGEIEERVKQFEADLVYFGNTVLEIANKDKNDITTFDFNVFQYKLLELNDGLNFIRRIVRSYHFCFRECDIKAAQSFVELSQEYTGRSFADLNGSFRNFESDSVREAV